MGTRLDRLLSIAGPSLGPPVPAGGSRGLHDKELSEFLAQSNGFFAFEGALHVFPSGPVPADVMSVQLWNDEHLWRLGYHELAEGLYFFAEDIFGGQFALFEDRVVTFEPETGAIEEIATNLEGWADNILTDYALLTGFPIAHQWQKRHGPLTAGKRLLPKRPFALGGEFSLENLHELDAVKGMQFRSELATQLKNLPEGATVKFKIIE
jgi:hypothetical protein